MQVYVPNSFKNSDVGHPFGYLKASTNLSCVNLFVMPYNYPVLLPLLDELFKVHRSKPSAEWRAQFQNYVRTMPPYYVGVSMLVFGSFHFIFIFYFFSNFSSGRQLHQIFTSVFFKLTVNFDFSRFEEHCLEWELFQIYLVYYFLKLWTTSLVMLFLIT